MDSGQWGGICDKTVSRMLAGETRFPLIPLYGMDLDPAVNSEASLVKVASGIVVQSNEVVALSNTR